jgi:hypothetical protein
MQPINLGKLQRVDLREIWTKEHIDFTPWLAENLHVLGEAIGIELELETVEKNVGAFRADILAKDVQTDEWVLVENQLERTDHGHLGQLMTYAAGLKAKTIVWIASQFAEEHIAALDWLNSITGDNVRIYGLQIELWRIETSVAPKFDIICRPNSWVKKSMTFTGSTKDRIKAAMLAALQNNKEIIYKNIAEVAGTSEKYVKKLGPALKKELGIGDRNTDEIPVITIVEAESSAVGE